MCELVTKIPVRFVCVVCRFDEHAQKDLPAMLQYVLKETGQKKLFYVGHSQGTIMGFAGFTFNQQLAQSIEIFFALAPVTKVANIKGAFRAISDARSIVEVRQSLIWTQTSTLLFIQETRATLFNY